MRARGGGRPARAGRASFGVPGCPHAARKPIELRRPERRPATPGLSKAMTQAIPGTAGRGAGQTPQRNTIKSRRPGSNRRNRVCSPAPAPLSHAGGGPAAVGAVAFVWRMGGRQWARPDSNRDARLRRPSLYPLRYGLIFGQKSKLWPKVKTQCAIHARYTAQDFAAASSSVGSFGSLWPARFARSVIRRPLRLPLVMHGQACIASQSLRSSLRHF